MSIAPLPINSSRTLPLLSEGLTAVRLVSDPRPVLAHAVFADLPDFAEIMTHIDQAAPAPTDVQATDCCSTSEPRAVSEKIPAGAEDLPMDSGISAVDETVLAATFSETGVAIQGVPPDDETGVRRSVLQPVVTNAEPEKGPVLYPNQAETAKSETHFPTPGPIAAGGQGRDLDTGSAWPVDMKPQEDAATKVKDRVISLQEFTFVAGAVRSGLSATTHDAAIPARYSALLAPGKEVRGLPRDLRVTPSPPKTETESAQKPQMTTIADPIGPVGPSSPALTRRDAAVVSHQMVLPEPETISSSQGMASPVGSSRVPEAHVPASGLGLSQPVVGTAALTVSVLPPSPVQQPMTDFPGASDQPAVMSLAVMADPSQPEIKSPLAGPVDSGDPAPLSATTEDLARDSRRAASQVPPIPAEKAVANRSKAAVFDMPSLQGGQDIASFVTNPAEDALAIGGAVIEGHVTRELAEGMTASAISTATASLRPDVAMPRIDLPRHVAHQIADVVTRAPDGPVDLHLNPEELGKVRISMAMVEGGITVTILAERPDTLDLMRRHIDQLAQEFRQLGYGLINFSFGQRNEGHENRPDGGRHPPVSDAADDTPGATHVDRGHGKENGLDMRI